jgi:hypothetical protein
MVFGRNYVLLQDLLPLNYKINTIRIDLWNETQTTLFANSRTGENKLRGRNCGRTITSFEKRKINITTVLRWDKSINLHMIAKH